MQYFRDTATNEIYAFNDDVKVTDTAGIYSFTTAGGVKLNKPITLKPYTPPVLTATEIASQAQAAAMAAYKRQALTALEATDTVMQRVAEAVALGLATMQAADVVAYVHYRRALRAVLSNNDPDVTAPLPVAPAYPVGT